MSSKRPPLPLRFLSRLLPSEIREAAIGDALEEYTTRVEARGRFRAIGWCWWQLLSPDIVRLRRELWRDHGSASRSRRRKIRIEPVLHALGQALARARHRPGFAFVSILTLALGLGATAAIFSVVYGVLLKPLPYEEPERLVSVGHHSLLTGEARLIGLTTGAYFVYRGEARLLEELGVYFEHGLNLSGMDRPERVEAASVSRTLFMVLGVSPSLGRGLTEEDDAPGAQNVALISHRLWQRLYGGEPDVVGRSVQLDGRETKIIGVMSESFRFPDAETELWTPLGLDPTRARNVSFHLRGVGRLAGGATLAAATSELDALFERPFELYPNEGFSAEELRRAGFRVDLRPLKEEIVGNVGDVLWVLLLAVGIILAVACANVANLFLVRSEARERELAVQVALGASRGQLVRDFLIESTLLGVMGGLAGVALAASAIRVLRWMAPAQLPRLSEIGLDGIVLTLTAGFALLSGLAFGALPALRLGRLRTTAALKQGSRTMGGWYRNRARTALVVLQLGLALVLLAASGLLLRTFQNLRSVDPGFPTRNLLLFELSLPSASYPSSEEAMRFHHRVLDRLRELPGTRFASAAVSYFGLPLANAANPNPVYVENHPSSGAAESVPIRIVMGDYFQTVGIPLHTGRAIERRDLEEETGAAVVSESFARKYWRDEDAIGKRISPVQGWPWLTVVGVAADVLQTDLAEAPGPAVYWATNLPEGRLYTSVYSMSYAVRTMEEPADVLPAVRDAVRELDAGLPLAEVSTMEHVVASSMERISFTMVLLGIAAVVAMLLGSVGIYGVVSYAVGRRTREIGLRMALGAKAGTILRMVLGQAARVIAVGVAAGLAGALSVTHILASLLFGVEPVDVVAYVSGTAILISIAFLASYLPASRAASLHPVRALREE